MAGPEHFQEQLFEVGKAQRELDVRNGPPDIVCAEAERLLRRRSEAADDDVRTQQDDGNVDVGQKIGEIVVGAV